MNVLESFVEGYNEEEPDNSLLLTYSPESVSGSYIKQSSNYYRAVQIKLSGYAQPDFTAMGIANIGTFGIAALIGAIFNFGGVVQERHTPLFMIFNYDPDGNVTFKYRIDEYYKLDNEYSKIKDTSYVLFTFNSYCQFSKPCDQVFNEEYWFNYDVYRGGYIDASTKSNVWVRKKTSYGPGGISDFDYYYSNDYI